LTIKVRHPRELRKGKLQMIRATFSRSFRSYYALYEAGKKLKAEENETSVKGSVFFLVQN
jgi:hypothetical protein